MWDLAQNVSLQKEQDGSKKHFPSQTMQLTPC